MGERQKILRKIAGHRRHIEAHQRKIEEELMKQRPNENRIELWRKQITNAQRQIEKLERRLKQR